MKDNSSEQDKNPREVKRQLWQRKSLTFMAIFLR